MEEASISTSNLEINNVKNVYNIIASHFDKTRFMHWKTVHEFILSVNTGTKFLDLGCGNGKYLNIRNDLDTYALDNCEQFITIVNNKYPGVKTYLSDVSNTPLPSNYFDSIISVAVIHHMATYERRLEMINEIGRILKFGGKCIVTAWATEQTHTKTLIKSQKISDQNDYLIPWQDQKTGVTSHRFYHLFVENELNQLIEMNPNLKIISTNFEKDNWNVLFEKV